MTPSLPAAFSIVTTTQRSQILKRAFSAPCVGHDVISLKRAITSTQMGHGTRCIHGHDLGEDSVLVGAPAICRLRGPYPLPN
jgi:hypothetical protein